jgi:dihydroxyacid dehydratase/phosphogluconate dehydratase
LDLGALTASGEPLGAVLDWWRKSERRAALRRLLLERDGVDADDVIMSAERAGRKGLTSTVCFPRGNLAPEGSVIKSTAIDPKVVDADGVYRKTGPARVFTREKDAVAAIKGHGTQGGGAATKAGHAAAPIKPGDVLVLCGRGPMGSGMEEIYQITSALKHLSFGREVAVVTDARFSGVSTGACIGHVGPEALAGGPLGKLRDGDRIAITVDRNRLVGTVDFVGETDPATGGSRTFSTEEGARILAARSMRPDLKPDDDLPADTRLWAALQAVGGGTWGGCVYDVEAIVAALGRP